ncbi:hypothetical protein TraAM80_00504 [Trypanosoma rangeli]|uniref:Transmembrane protein n=1 Tax=Trypanosoma rangeli TaxID=5698 RepID=A0A3R7MVT5_TRYRA|nr:uncharacterized protein TraAM80_00504 [Trypanosoma rangeli]RNF12087.1 hypothetical protein TraAM80_00504 [Trypanosoma rangeli]|eukprot:RNF12087.1 hypothetical protein TraAM80_00504 [Trypanosoma rangeli]
MDHREGPAAAIAGCSSSDISGVGEAPGQCSQQPWLQYAAGRDGAEPEQQLFYHVNMNELTNALLVPAGILSSRLQPRTPLIAMEGQATQATPCLGREENGDHSSSNNGSGKFLEAVPATLPPRLSRHRNTLKAALLQSPENTYYVEDTLVIGSVGRRGGLVERSNSATKEQQPQGSPTFPERVPVSTSPISVRSLPVSLVHSPLALPWGQFSDVSGVSSSRGASFHVQRPSQIECGVDSSSEDSIWLEQAPLTGDMSAEKKSTVKKKRVHFPDNVIKSVSVVQADDQLRLLVEYNRPWYAHLVLVVASAFFVLHWGFIALVTKPSPASERMDACVLVSFVAFGFASAYLLAFLALTWRPSSEELGFLMDCSRNRSVLCVLLAGVFSQLSLVAAFMLSGNFGSLVCFCCIPLFLTYLYEEYKQHAVSVLDGIGCFLVVVSIVVFCIGFELKNPAGLYGRIISVCIALMGGAAMALFLFQVRTVSRFVSNFFIMSSTVTLATLLLAFAAYITGAFAAHIGTSHRTLTQISSEDFLNIILSALFLFLSWFTYHWSSLFFDRMTLSGSFSLGGPMSLLVFHLLSLPTVCLPYEIAGGVAMVIGCALVLYSGYRFRQNVEVRIELERE